MASDAIAATRRRFGHSGRVAHDCPRNACTQRETFERSRDAIHAALGPRPGTCVRAYRGSSGSVPLRRTASCGVSPCPTISWSGPSRRTTHRPSSSLGSRLKSTLGIFLLAHRHLRRPISAVDGRCGNGDISDQTRISIRFRLDRDRGTIEPTCHEEPIGESLDFSHRNRPMDPRPLNSRGPRGAAERRSRAERGSAPEECSSRAPSSRRDVCPLRRRDRSRIARRMQTARSGAPSRERRPVRRAYEPRSSARPGRDLGEHVRVVCEDDDRCVDGHGGERETDVMGSFPPVTHTGGGSGRLNRLGQAMISSSLARPLKGDPTCRSPSTATRRSPHSAGQFDGPSA